MKGTFICFSKTSKTSVIFVVTTVKTSSNLAYCCIISLRFPWQTLTYPSWYTNMPVKPPVSVIGVLLEHFSFLQVICNLTYKETSGWLIGLHYKLRTSTEMACLPCSTEAVLPSIFLCKQHEFRWNKNPKTLTCPCWLVNSSHKNFCRIICKNGCTWDCLSR